MLIHNSSNVSSSALDSKTFVFRSSSIRRRQLFICGSVKGRSGCLLDVKQAESVGFRYSLMEQACRRHIISILLMAHHAGAGISSTLIPKP
jgi:hypothetical protein